MNLALFVLAIELRSWGRHLRLSFVRAYVWCALLALHIQGALPR